MRSIPRGRLGGAPALVALLIVGPLATFVMAAWLMGWQLLSVQSGSMGSTYPVGSLIVVGAKDASQVAAGMPVVFDDPLAPDHLVIHRVVGIVPTPNLAFTTQGDANLDSDPVPVPARSVHGRVLWHVAGLGFALDWIAWPRSFVLLVVIPGVLLVANEVLERRRRGRRIGPENSPLEA